MSDTSVNKLKKLSTNSEEYKFKRRNGLLDDSNFVTMTPTILFEHTEIKELNAPNGLQIGTLNPFYNVYKFDVASYKERIIIILQQGANLIQLNSDNTIRGYKFLDYNIIIHLTMPYLNLVIISRRNNQLFIYDAVELLTKPFENLGEVKPLLDLSHQVNDRMSLVIIDETRLACCDAEGVHILTFSKTLSNKTSTSLTMMPQLIFDAGHCQDIPFCIPVDKNHFFIAYRSYDNIAYDINNNSINKNLTHDVNLDKSSTNPKIILLLYDVKSLSQIKHFVFIHKEMVFFIGESRRVLAFDNSTFILSIGYINEDHYKFDLTSQTFTPTQHVDGHTLKKDMLPLDESYIKLVKGYLLKFMPEVLARIILDYSFDLSYYKDY